MTNTAVITDNQITTQLKRKAAKYNMSLSDYINLVVRYEAMREDSIVDDIQNEFDTDSSFVSEEQMAYFIVETDKTFNDPDTIYIDAHEALAELDRKYGLSR